MSIYAAILILGIVASAWILVASFKKDGLVCIIVNPVVLFTAYFMTVHFLTPLIKYTSQWFRYEGDYSEILFIYTGLLSLLYLGIAVLLNAFFSKNNRKLLEVSGRCLPTRRAVQVTFFSGLVLSTAGIFAAWRDLQTINAVAGGVQQFLLDRHHVSQDRETSRVFFNLAIVGSALLLAVFLNGKKRLLRLVPWSVVVGLSVYYSVLLSSRNSILIIVLLNVATYAFFSIGTTRPKGSRNLRQLTVLSSAIVALACVGYVTTYNRYTKADSAYLLERRNNIVFYTMDGAFGNDEARLWMLKNSHPYYFGLTYAAALVNFIPRDLWEKKPLGGGPHLINLISPGSYVIGEKGNNSLTTGLVVEARMNFGLVGVLFAIFLWAYLSNKCVRAAFKTASIIRKVALITIAVFLSSSLIYSEFLGWLTRLLLFALPLWGAGMFERTRLRIRT